MDLYFRNEDLLLVRGRRQLTKRAIDESHQGNLTASALIVYNIIYSVPYSVLYVSYQGMYIGKPRRRHAPRLLQ